MDMDDILSTSDQLVSFIDSGGMGGQKKDTLSMRAFIHERFVMPEAV